MNEAKGPKWTAELERCLLELSGDIMEIGVFRGGTFNQMLCALRRMAEPRTKHTFNFLPKTYAVDSWEGMAAPGPLDGDQYPKGKFSQATVEVFHQGMAQRGWSKEDYVACKGWVPEVLLKFPADLSLSFVHVDLDQFQPTVDAAEWAWRHLPQGGVIAFHDWYPAKAQYAAAGISTFLHTVADRLSGRLEMLVEGDELMLVKP